jgi:hypothetical protein
MPFGIIITAAACQMLLIPELPPVIGTYHTNALYYKGGGFSNFAKTTNNRTAGAIEEPPLTPPPRAGPPRRQLQCGYLLGVLATNYQNLPSAGVTIINDLISHDDTAVTVL